MSGSATADPRRGVLFWTIVATIYAVTLVGAIEVIGQVAYRVRHGWWLPQTNANSKVHYFRRSPYLAVENVPSVSSVVDGQRMTHNSLGYRGVEITRAKPAGVKRIVVFGGSSTYCVGVGDEDTWPHRLQIELGPGYEVINAATPGYTTVENLIQTEFRVDALQPDLCLYYEGYNDMRSSHVRELAGDYSNFHGRALTRLLGQSRLRRGNGIYVVRKSHELLQALFALERPDSGFPAADAHAHTARVDAHALALYRRNLITIAAVGRVRGWRAMFAPQLLMPSKISRTEFVKWVPLIRPEDAAVYQEAYNAAMRDAAAQQAVPFVDSLLGLPLTREDFLDDVHLSPTGCRKFAKALAPHVRQVLSEQGVDERAQR